MAPRRSRRGASRTTGGRTTVRNNAGAGTGFSTSTQMSNNVARFQNLQRIASKYAPGGSRVLNGFS